MFFAQTVPGVGELDSLVDTSNVTGWDFLWAAIALLVAFVLSRWVKRLVHKSLQRFELPEDIPNLLARLAGWLVILVGIVYALSLLGFDMSPVVLFILVVGLVVFLAGRPMLENLGAGIMLQARGAFAVGDQIRSNDFEGTVEEVNGRAVVILQTDGERVHIPNITVLYNPITNLTDEGARRTTVTVGVEYGTDLQDARDVLLATTGNVQGVRADPEVEVFVEEFDDSSINFLVRFWHDPEIRAGFVVRDEVSRAIKSALDDAAIVIAFPQRVLWWGDGEQGGADEA